MTLKPITNTGYVLDIDCFINVSEVLNQRKRGMHQFLNIHSTAWSTQSFLNYIEHGTYDNLRESDKQN